MFTLNKIWFTRFVFKIIRAFSPKRFVKPNSGFSEWLFHPFVPGSSGVVPDGPPMFPRDRPVPFCSGRWSPASWSGDRFVGARSAHIQHLVITRWPGARPSHAAVTSRLIAHHACVHACLLKTSSETHEPLAVCVGGVLERAGASLSIRCNFLVTDRL